MMQVEWEKSIDYLDETKHSNVVIASYVTAYARLELYNILHKLNNRVLYFDTDSIIFKCKHNEWKPETGIFLGQLTNELPTNKDPNVFISKFASCGPKNYSYELTFPSTNTVEYVCKVKGLTLNFSTLNTVNFQTMKLLINNFVLFSQNDQLAINVPQMTFQVTKNNDIFTKNGTKLYRLVYDKRRLCSNYKTLPFGYVDSIN
jgi:hypothetical protein